MTFKKHSNNNTLGQIDNLFQRFRLCQKGSALIEFGFVAPILILFIVGIMEVAMIMFANGLVEGGVREAARFAITGSEINGRSREEHIIDRVNQVTLNLFNLDESNVDILIYPSFEDIGKPEPFQDTAPANGQFDDGEDFNDINGNGVWDQDMGVAGAGGPQDVVIYRVNYTWPLMTGMLAKAIGTSIDMQASIAVRNEPYEDP
ncbi:TadE/TadG family type IV pilus assembly protein [Kiloniella sp. b19]|uniref:TadE/TadG family type IV pilus assembly protein n=1 Tax=Kiloniella sp. GXU_MW_B19 TaxID=3141326 RepID=UPI0031D0523F